MNAADDTIYLLHIFAIAKVKRYLTGIDQAAFMREQNSLVQDGVIRQLHIIGEAARRLSPELRGRYPEVPWRDIVGMRNKRVHGDFGIDLTAVWLTAN
jgi:uncharacterized protein with HEPN domain